MFIQWFMLLFDNSITVFKQIEENFWTAKEEENMQEVNLEDGKCDELMDGKNYVPAIPEDIYGVML